MQPPRTGCAAWLTRQVGGAQQEGLGQCGLQEATCLPACLPCERTPARTMLPRAHGVCRNAKQSTRSLRACAHQPSSSIIMPAWLAIHLPSCRLVRRPPAPPTPPPVRPVRLQRTPCTRLSAACWPPWTPTPTSGALRAAWTSRRAPRASSQAGQGGAGPTVGVKRIPAGGVGRVHYTSTLLLVWQPTRQTTWCLASLLVVAAPPASAILLLPPALTPSPAVMKKLLQLGDMAKGGRGRAEVRVRRLQRGGRDHWQGRQGQW